MSIKVKLDPGHKRGVNKGTCYYEGDNNWAYAQVLKTELEKAGFEVSLTKTSVDHDPTLEARGRSAEGCDLFLSLHSDALGSSTARGVTILDDVNPKYANTTLATKLGQAIAKALGTNFRGVRYRYLSSGVMASAPKVGESNYYGVLRSSYAKHNMLIEHGFHTNPDDCNAFKTRHREVAQATANVLKEFYGMSTGTPIMAKPTTTVEQMQAYAESKNADPLFMSLASTFYNAAVAVGVDPAVVYAQSGKETGYMHWGGVLNASFKNPCGLKTTKGGSNEDKHAHQKFATWKEGIEAQVDHLALYAGAQGYPKPNSPDPRHFPDIKGVAPTVEQLGGRWAPSPTYGADIVQRMKELTSVKAKESESVETPKKEEKQLDVAQKWAVDAGIMADRRWDEPLTKQETAWVLRDLVRKVIQK